MCGMLEALQFDNGFVRSLAADPEVGPRRRQISNACYSRVEPTPVAAPELVAYAVEVAELLDLTPEDCTSDAFVEVFSGNRLLPGMDPFATCYGGHQFGNWAGQLGDGRAINLGEVINASGKRWTLQLKGAGPTPYSRTADGLAVLRSSVREFLCSEAMHHLGVPTTRALSLVLTGERVMRDMFYDGHPALEPGAVVCRVAQSFTRFGHFEMLAARGEVELLREFTDYTLRTDFPHLLQGKSSIRSEDYVALFQEVCRTTAEMVAHWMRVGFVHGVMNTDNMSVLGLTIDYGPYGWLEDFDFDWTPNTTDAGGRRYRYGNQPGIAQWNLLQLAQALLPLIQDPQPLEASLSAFAADYEGRWEAMMADKLGLSAPAAGDSELFARLQGVLQLAETDMTTFFRRLAAVVPQTDPGERLDLIKDAYYRPEQLSAEHRQAMQGWLDDYVGRLRQEVVGPRQRLATMNAANPAYVLRNYQAQLAIDAADGGDFARIHELLELLRDPYTEQPGKEAFAAKRPDWARTRAGCSMLSCSS
jgi:uncharacterized protein YdiU (UPF0061 family)